MSKAYIFPWDGKDPVYGVNRIALDDDDLTFEERGLLAFLLTRGPTYRMRVKTLMREGKVGRDKLYQMVSHLQTAGYIRRFRKFSDGALKQWVFLIFGKPTKIRKEVLQGSLPESDPIPQKIRSRPSPGFPLMYPPYEIIYPLGEGKRKGEGGKEKGTPFRAFSLDQRTHLLLSRAKRLAGIIQRYRHVKISSMKLFGWASQIRRLHENEGVSMDRIDDALDWYEEHVREPYVPVIESGQSLRDKFLKLEAAMERAGDLHPEETESTRKPKIRVGHV